MSGESHQVADAASELIKVFFYGTLKRNQPNAEHVVNQRAQFVSEAVTADKWPLVIGSDYNVPFLLYKQGYGKNVQGEIYLIDKAAKEFFDDFEGVHDGFYACKLIEVIEKSTGQSHQAYTYVLENFNEESLLGPSAILFDNYSSVNEFYPEYQKRLDTPENLDKVLVSVKSNHK